VENRFRFLACALLKGSIMPETNLQNGSGIAGPLNRSLICSSRRYLR
jgi:hypothetical protein